MIWRNLRRGRHTVTVRAFCTDDEGNILTTTRRKFNFRVRLTCLAVSTSLTIVGFTVFSI